ncbi:MAG: sigma-70 family RNA polymerase sigma factor [Dehalococcoidia bacterium]|nr:sigma-70 family RNA polymerase sigma factor [Dehalococcoidia bacterium]
MIEAVAIQRGAQMQAAQASGPPSAGTAGAARPPRTTGYDAAFCKTYETYYTKVFAFVYSRVREVDLARDLAAEVFERAYVKGETVREPGAYAAWLFMIAKNSIAGHFRRQKREFTQQERAREDLRFVGSPPTPEDHLLRDERIRNLMYHVRQLRRRDQELISLKFDAELTHEEIGKIMGMTPLNVRVSIFRALNRLKVLMEKDLAR